SEFSVLENAWMLRSRSSVNDTVLCKTGASGASGNAVAAVSFFKARSAASHPPVQGTSGSFLTRCRAWRMSSRKSRYPLPSTFASALGRQIVPSIRRGCRLEHVELTRTLTTSPLVNDGAMARTTANAPLTSGVEPLLPLKVGGGDVESGGTGVTK